MHGINEEKAWTAVSEILKIDTDVLSRDYGFLSFIFMLVENEFRIVAGSYPFLLPVVVCAYGPK